MNDEERALIVPTHTRENIGAAFKRARERVYQLLEEGKRAVEWPGGGVIHVQGYDNGGRLVEVVKWKDVSWNPDKVKQEQRRLHPLPDAELSDCEDPEPIVEIMGRIMPEQGVPF